MAWGDDNTAPAVGNTALGNEEGRKEVSSQVVGVSAGKVKTVTIRGAQDAVGQIEEFGWFADDATSTAGSGIMVARVLYSRLKTDSESLQVDRIDDVG